MLKNSNVINLSELSKIEDDFIRKSRTKGIWICVQNKSLVPESKDIIVYKKNEIVTKY